MAIVFNPFTGNFDLSGSSSGGTVTNVTASSPLASSGGNTPNLSLTGTVAIANGGTGQTSSNNALNALLPTQATHSGQFLTTDGTNSSWSAISAANTALSNLASTTVNADIRPASNNAVDLGSIGLGWNQIVGKNIYGTTLLSALDGNTDTAVIIGTNQTSPSSTNVNGIRTGNLATPRSLALWSTNDANVDAKATYDVLVETGNKTAGTGNSGSVRITIGTSSGGTRGKLVIKDGSEGTSGHVWTSTDTVGSGHWAAASGGANTALSNLASTAVNASILPSALNSVALGDSSHYWSNITSRSMVLYNASNISSINFLGADFTFPSGTTVNGSIVGSGGSSTGIMTSNGSSSKDLRIETGNGTVTNSGNIILQIGTANATVGTIQLNSATVLGQTSQTITAGQTVSAATSFNAIQAAGAVSTSTSTVIDTGRANGQILQVVNIGSQNITFKAGGNTDLPSLTDYVLTPSSSIAFIWQGSTWYTTSVSIN